MNMVKKTLASLLTLTTMTAFLLPPPSAAFYGNNSDMLQIDVNCKGSLKLNCEQVEDDAEFEFNRWQRLVYSIARSLVEGHGHSLDNFDGFTIVLNRRYKFLEDGTGRGLLEAFRTMARSPQGFHRFHIDMRIPGYPGITTSSPSYQFIFRKLDKRERQVINIIIIR